MGRAATRAIKTMAVLGIVFLVGALVATAGIGQFGRGAAGYGVVPMVVLSGSMEPSIKTGSLLFVGRVAADRVVVGDVITYRTPASERPSQNGSDLTTHRVAAVTASAEGPVFTTRGDANTAPDMTLVPGSEVVGRALFAVPYVGYASAFARSKEGVLLLVVLPALIVIVMEVRSIVRTLRSRERDGYCGDRTADSTLRGGS
jgi:signal peptidase